MGIESDRNPEAENTENRWNKFHIDFGIVYLEIDESGKRGRYPKIWILYEYCQPVNLEM